jgi:hypothetical protein
MTNESIRSPHQQICRIIAQFHFGKDQHQQQPADPVAGSR